MYTKSAKKNSSVQVTTAIKAGGLGFQNHSRSVTIRVKTAIKAGAAIISMNNHSRAMAKGARRIKVVTTVRAGGLGFQNHSRPAISVRTSLKAGAAIISMNNHSRALFGY